MAALAPSTAPARGVAGGFAVGMALTDDCDLACAHCYRDVLNPASLSLADVRAVCESIPVRSLNLGTGENGLHPEFHEVLAYLRERGIRHTITTNGYSAGVLSDDELRGFHSLEVSLDFPTEAEQDAFRAPGNFRQCLGVLDRCRRLGITAGVTAVMMSTNYHLLPQVARIAADHGATFRVNVYQPVKTDRFSLTYEQFWEGFRRLFAQTRVVACTEPLVNALLGLGGIEGPGCGQGTIRVTARRRTLPCVYWPVAGPPVAALAAGAESVTESAEWQRIRTVPPACLPCPLVATCRGGCTSRRVLRGALDQPDEFCPIVRGDTVTLDWLRAAGADLPKAGSACTTIVTALDA